MIALGIFILSVLLVAIPVAVKGNNVHTMAGFSIDSSAKHGPLHRRGDGYPKIL
ncbi:unnamed protein product [Penicillium camemberti]|uniref:Str. FM013 n=1 Tax=Penicillium camemberti (strain FM 013) TaxID=1429867 RepID=A0A0G4PPA1_PENC3|nr:unnamed protein product [Penicillium camemberti]